MNIDSLKTELDTVRQSYEFIEAIEEWQTDMRNSLALLGDFIEAQLAYQTITEEDVKDAIEGLEFDLLYSQRKSECGLVEVVPESLETLIKAYKSVVSKQSND